MGGGGGGDKGRADHGKLILRSVNRVGIFVCDPLQQGLQVIRPPLLAPGWGFFSNYFVLGVGNLLFF